MLLQSVNLVYFLERTLDCFEVFLYSRRIKRAGCLKGCRLLHQYAFPLGYREIQAEDSIECVQVFRNTLLVQVFASDEFVDCDSNHPSGLFRNPIIVELGRLLLDHQVDPFRDI